MVTRLWVWGQAHTISDEDGASLVEYALLVALIAVAAIITIQALSTNINSTLQNVTDELPAGGGGSGGGS